MRVTKLHLRCKVGILSSSQLYSKFTPTAIADSRKDVCPVFETLIQVASDFFLGDKKVEAASSLLCPVCQQELLCAELGTHLQYEIERLTRQLLDR